MERCKRFYELPKSCGQETNDMIEKKVWLLFNSQDKNLESQNFMYQDFLLNYNILNVLLHSIVLSPFIYSQESIHVWRYQSSQGDLKIPSRLFTNLLGWISRPWALHIFPHLSFLVFDFYPFVSRGNSKQEYGHFMLS